MLVCGDGLVLFRAEHTLRTRFACVRLFRFTKGAVRRFSVVAKLAFYRGRAGVNYR